LTAKQKGLAKLQTPQGLLIPVIEVLSGFALSYRQTNNIDAHRHTPTPYPILRNLHFIRNHSATPVIKPKAYTIDTIYPRQEKKGVVQ
jgi:hypothetical protein